MQKIDKKKKSLEGELILDKLDNKTLEFLMSIEGNSREQLFNILDFIVMRDKEEIYRITSGQTSIDSMIKIANKQNFLAGRVSAYVLLDYIITHADQKLSERMKGEEKGVK